MMNAQRELRCPWIGHGSIQREFSRVDTYVRLNQSQHLIADWRDVADVAAIQQGCPLKRPIFEEMHLPCQIGKELHGGH